jgi:hypothetical protein
MKLNVLTLHSLYIQRVILIIKNSAGNINNWVHNYKTRTSSDYYQIGDKVEAGNLK